MDLNRISPTCRSYTSSRIWCSSFLEKNLIRCELENFDHTCFVNYEHCLKEGRSAILQEIMDALVNPQQAKACSLSMDLAARESLRFFVIFLQTYIWLKRLLLRLLPVKLRHCCWWLVALLIPRKIPLKLDAQSAYFILKRSALKKQIAKASWIVWQNANNAPARVRGCWSHATEHTKQQRRTLWGETCVMSGEFRHILPVVVRSTPAEQKPSTLAWFRDICGHLYTTSISRCICVGILPTIRTLQKSCLPFLRSCFEWNRDDLTNWPLFT